MNTANFDYITNYKLDILKMCNTSEEIVESLQRHVSSYYSYCGVDSYDVYDEPYCNGQYIDEHVELLSDLLEYTQLVKVDADIPDYLMYIHNHVNN